MLKHTKEKKMSEWIRTKAGLQMAETIIRYLPRITVCLEELAKKDDSHDDKDDKRYTDDLLKLCDEMDIRKQENINLSHRVTQVCKSSALTGNSLERLEQIVEDRR